MQITNALSLPESIVRAVTAGEFGRPRDKYISVTTLISPPRQVALRRQHWDEITEDASDRIWSLIGQIAHGILEKADGLDALTEERLSVRVEGWTVSGQFDRLVMLPDETLQDYKTCSAWSVKNGEPKPEWIAQLSVYAEILRQHSFAPRRAEIIAIVRDWRKGEALRSPSDYPQRQVVVIPIPLWPSDETRDYMRKRVLLHQAAQAGDLPECSAEDRWQRGEAYAVMADGRKTAIRVLKGEAEAAMLAEELAAEDKRKRRHYVEHRPGANVRCESYCVAAPFCDQWAAIKDKAEQRNKEDELW